MRMMVAVCAALVVGIALFWPRGGPLIESAPVHTTNDASEVGGEVTLATEGGAVRSEPSLHARIVEATRTAPNDDFPESMSELMRQANEKQLPPPRLITGPPGKPALMEGASQTEVLATWGEPALIEPEMSVPPLPDGEYGPTRRLEAWSYVGATGSVEWFCYWDGGAMSSYPWPRDEALELRREKARRFVRMAELQLEEPSQ